MLSILSVLLTSCSSSKPDDSTTTFQVSSQNKQHWEAGKLVDDSVAIIKPTWGQAIYYANESGTVFNKILAVLSLLAFGFTLFMLTRVNGITQTIGVGILIVATLSGFIYGWWGKASTVKGNNKKEVPIQLYRSVLNTTGTSQTIWDTLYTDNKIVGAASK